MPDNEYPGTVDANGDLEIVVQSRPRAWRVTQVSVKGPNAPSGSRVELRKNGAFITRIRATGGAAGGDPPVDLYPSDKLTVNGSGLTSGDQFNATVFYQVIERA